MRYRRMGWALKTFRREDSVKDTLYSASFWLINRNTTVYNA